MLDFCIHNLDNPLYMDFKEEPDRLMEIKANGKEITPVFENEHLKIEPEYLTEGNNTVEIDFLAGELSLNRNEEYLYTLLVPDRARTLFPCFDQPNIKATYTLNITAPNDWQVLCGAPEIKTEEHEGFINHQFVPSDKMSTYLFSFVAGKFKLVNDNSGAFSMKALYRETNKAKVAYSLDSIFKLHRQSLSFLEDYTDCPFPFQKLDFASIPGFQYGGMEHVGAIQYKEGALFLDETSTKNAKLSRAKLIAHETAHMWFGDLVTMDWFNDVWMKEVFANFMADKIVNPAFPEIDHQLAFMTTHYPGAYGEDRTKGTNAIRQELGNLNNAGSLYGSIIYNKAPIMMRQLENLMGKEAFQQGIQEYIKTYKYGNADWNDLIQILDKNSLVAIDLWSEVWANSSSRPLFNESITYDEDNRVKTFEIYQVAEDGSGHVWPQTFDITLIYKESVRVLTVAIKEERLALSEAKGMPKPLAIIYNSNGMGYGVFPQNPETLVAIPEIKSQVARGYGYINGYENTLNGKIDPTTILKLYRNGLYKEKNELIVNLISGYLRSIFWKYLTSDERELYQQPIADQLWSQLHSNIPPNIKKTLFYTFRSIAYSPKSKNQLYRVWNKDVEISNLKLNADDFTEIAMDLALYRHQDQHEILTKAKAAITNPDKLERFEFLLPSLSADPKVKNLFFKSLGEAKNREKEAWVISAMDNLNHPLRRKEALVYLRPSLDLLVEIQKTGDIFFPKRWLSSTIGNHTSVEAYQILLDFLKENPGLNPSLIKKIWQASDDLRRIQSLHNPTGRSVD